MEKIILHWVGEHVFIVENKSSCSGMTPKEMMLFALSKCSGLASVYMIEKIHVHPKSLVVDAEGEMPEEDVQSGFTKFKVAVHVECETEDAEKVRAIIMKAIEKYCPIGKMYSKIAPIEHEVIVNGR